VGIPFGRLGPVFARFGHRTYPRWAWPLFEQEVRGWPPAARVLDLGGGTGVLAARARAIRSDLELVVLDPAAGMLRHVPPGLRTVTGRAEALPFAPDHLNAVLLGEALHHFQDAGAALAEIARVLRPGGKLWIYEFDPTRGIGRWVYWGERLLGEPAAFFTPQALQGRLAALGFTGDFVERDGRYVLSARLAGETPREAARPA